MWKMAYAMEHGMHVGCERDAKHLRTCATLLRRLQADDYFANAGYEESTWGTLPERQKSWAARHATYMARQDSRYLGLLLGKYLQDWWD